MFNIFSYSKLNKELKEKTDIEIKNSLKVDILEKENKVLRESISSLEQRLGDPAEVIKKVLGRPIKWKDVSRMKPEQQRAYYLEAKNVLENEAFINEISAMEYDLVNDIAKNTEDFQQVLNRRFILCGVLALKERLENIPTIETEVEDEEELNEAI